MTAQEIDTYLASLDEPGRTTSEQLRATIREVLADAEEGLSYGMPAFKVQGKAVAGFAIVGQATNAAAKDAWISTVPSSGEMDASGTWT